MTFSLSTGFVCEGFFIWLMPIRIVTFRLQNRLECYEMAPFAGSYIEGSFFQKRFLSKLHSYIYLIQSSLFCLTVGVCLAEYNLVCDFSVNFWRNGCILANLDAYQVKASFFKTTFNFRHFRCCKVCPHIGCSTDQHYFNQTAPLAIFSKNFLTNFFFGLLFGLSRCLPIRGTIFRKP